jgi:predicted metal-dependent phosphoesterase TrpH
VAAAGVVFAGAIDSEAPPPPMSALGYTVLAGDFHVHGTPDGIPPWDAAREARRRRLDVIALTSHNSLRGWWLWTRAPWLPAGADQVLVLPGEELTSAGFHLALVGITRTIPWRQPLADIAADTRAQGGVTILAHPDGDAFRRSLADDGLRALDGIEVAYPFRERPEQSSSNFSAILQRATAANPRIAMIGSSDFHFFSPIGLGRTSLFVDDRSSAGVLEAIRAGRTVACDARGRVVGPPNLTAAVAERCRHDASAPPVGDTLLSRAGTLLAWVGLLALVLLGPSARQAHAISRRPRPAAQSPS